MPDFIIAYTYVCDSNIQWETTVPGSKPGTSYTVSWGRNYDPEASCEYGWSCTCHAFKFSNGVPCKHIRAVEASKARCGWNSCLEPGMEAAKDANGEPCCPECGGPVTVMKVAV